MPRPTTNTIASSSRMSADRPRTTTTYASNANGKGKKRVIEPADEDEEDSVDSEEEAAEEPRAGPSRRTGRNGVTGNVTGGKRSKGNGSSSRRTPRGSHDDDDDDDDDNHDDRGDSDPGEGEGVQRSAIENKARENMGREVYQKKVNELVRLCLFLEYRKQPIRRDDINKRILDKSNYKVFNSLIEDANNILNTTMGMELVEMRPRGQGAEERPTSLAGRKDKQSKKKTSAEKKEEEEAQQKKKSTAARSYVLRSILSPKLIQLMNDPDPIPFPETTIDSPTTSIRFQRSGFNQDCGALLDWEKGDGGAIGGGVACIGLLFVVLGLIMAHGRAVSASSLLMRMEEDLEILPGTNLPFLSTDSTSPSLTFEGFLTAMVKQSYLEKTKLNAISRNSDSDFEWKWGSRADAEIGEKAVAEFMAEIMIGDTLNSSNRGARDASSSDEDQQPGPSQRRNTQGTSQLEANPDDDGSGNGPNLGWRKNNLVGKIARAAGSDLAGMTSAMKA